VRHALDALPPELPDLLDPELRERQALMARRTAIEASHFPASDASVDEFNAFPTPAQRRLIFEEFFLFQIGHAWRRHQMTIERKPHQVTVDDRIRQSAARVLPFHLTPGQAYEIGGNGNKSAVHWDMVNIQRPEYGGGEIWFDGKLIRKDGLFTTPTLKKLNPDQLLKQG
jgi:hypothetical protein